MDNDKPKWENKEQPVSKEDLQILLRAKEILSDELIGSNGLRRFNLYFPKPNPKVSAILTSKYPTIYIADNRSTPTIKKSFISLKIFSFLSFKLNILSKE